MRCYLVRNQPGSSDWLKHGQLTRSSKVLFRSLTTPPRFDAAPVFFLILGIVLVTVGMTIGLGRSHHRILRLGGISYDSSLHSQMEMNLRRTGPEQAPRSTVFFPIWAA